ncbi:hypothetical protein CAPTEDRAFT_193384 [Capitella teleta]|uniref:Cyanophycinase n=1 Tax=Capitella teleta TaxID=283909 RepID=R7TB49_CAPTE|nr:hypothetical protein CAPTEDRAFT_193384 [Capitella teleta]|eukprot:ELT90727.1 hypothetical protein CAPTEDRAFT_193384 [Capitella teleta]
MNALLIFTFLLPLRGLCEKLVLVGGGLSDDNEEIWGTFLDLAGGASSASIGIITAASADPQDSYDYYEDLLLKRYDVNEVYWIPIHVGNTEANEDPVVIANIGRMTGFFAGGGDQARILESFYNNGEESSALVKIKEMYFSEEAVMGGTSAGAAVVGSAPMIMGGMSYEALRYGAFPEGEEGGPDDLIYEPGGGIGLLDSHIVDSHYSERGREGRLARLVWDTRNLPNGVQFGIGVDEDTAFVITGDSLQTQAGEVFGRAGVMLIDVTNAVQDPDAAYFRLDDVRLHYMTHGDHIRMRTHFITFDDSWKSNLAGDEEYDRALTTDKIFDGTRSSSFPEFQRVARSIFDSRLDDSTEGQTEESAPKFEVFFHTEAESEGWGGYSPLHGGWEISYHALWCSIYDLSTKKDNLK